MIQEALQSYFILSKIKTTKWENRNYIKELLLLLRLMKKTKLSAAEGQLYFLLRNKYQQDFLQLLKDADPIKYRAFMEEQELAVQQKITDKLNKIQKIKATVQSEIDEYNLWLSIQRSA